MLPSTPPHTMVGPNNEHTTMAGVLYNHGHHTGYALLTEGGRPLGIPIHHPRSATSKRRHWVKLMSFWPISTAQPSHPLLSTPTHYQAWKEQLQNYPDAEFACYILQGLQCGFRIRMAPGTHIQSAQSNMQSTKEHPQTIAAVSVKRPCRSHPGSFPHVRDYTNWFSVITNQASGG